VADFIFRDIAVEQTNSTLQALLTAKKNRLKFCLFVDLLAFKHRCELYTITATLAFRQTKGKPVLMTRISRRQY